MGCQLLLLIKKSCEIMTIDKEKLFEIKRKPPLFIVGCQRSGTSFLYRVLSEVLNIGFGRDNTLFMNYFKYIDQYGDLSINVNLQKLLNNIARSHVFQRRFKSLPINCNGFIKCLENRQYNDIVRSIYAYWALKQGKDSWGGKTPDYTGHIEPLVKLFPDVKIIHIVRDGRDTALSFKGLKWGPKDSYVAANYWRKRVVLGSFSRKYCKENFLEFRYEDLMEAPEEIFCRIINFLGIEGVAAEKKILQFRDKIVPMIMSSNIFKWEKKMSKQDIRIFEITAGEILELYGYEILNKNYQNYSLPLLVKIYHYLRNYYLKITNGDLFRFVSRWSSHYKF